jgi:hypothetical protein
MRWTVLMGVIAIAGCASNRGSDDPEARIRDTTYQDTINSADTSHGTREMPDSGDSASRRLSAPPPTDSVQ